MFVTVRYLSMGRKEETHIYMHISPSVAYVLLLVCTHIILGILYYMMDENWYINRGKG